MHLNYTTAHTRRQRKYQESPYSLITAYQILNITDSKDSPEHQETMFRACFFDHIFDHKQIWSTRRQECQKARFDNFCVPERSKRGRNVQKMVKFSIGSMAAND